MTLKPPKERSITSQERHVLLALCDGLTVREIAEEMGIARQTVYVHSSRGRAVMQADNLGQVGRWFREEKERKEEK